MAKNTIKVLGSSSHTDAERSKLDYYGTDPRSTRALLEVEKFNNNNVWEPCAGHHLIANELIKEGYTVRLSDIAEYDGYEHELIDFLNYEGTWSGDICTNPPYGLATSFIEKALNIVEPGCKIAMFLRLQYLEGKGRYEKIFKDNPPKTVYVFINRQTSSKVDDFTVGSAVAYCWFIWEKGSKTEPIIRWLSTAK